jgi:hypothetical protein
LYRQLYLEGNMAVDSSAPVPRRGIDLQHAPYAALMLRVALGLVFVAHAWLKVAVLTLPGTAAFFERFGFPGWTVYPVFALELLGGTALIVAQAACFRHAAASRVPATMSSTARMPKAA